MFLPFSSNPLSLRGTSSGCCDLYSSTEELHQGESTWRRYARIKLFRFHVKPFVTSPRRTFYSDIDSQCVKSLSLCSCRSFLWCIMFREQERASFVCTSLPDDRYRLKYNTVIVTFQATHCDNLCISVECLKIEINFCYNNFF